MRRGGTMKDSTSINKVSINHCIRDSELDEFDALSANADPGEWRVRDGKVERYSRGPFQREAGSLAMMAKSVSVIPRLVKGICVLEAALESAWVSAGCAHRELREARSQHEKDIARAFKGETGPDAEILA